ncbi:thymidine phosphorylase [Ruminococcaceae bacterium CPB6]|uniref:Pyrimidine-nucleoside phosphorylase n=2 Tax=Oscillospiraceae TaxID=216572 RepID=A0A859DXT6_9FIRM|nr:thymidine phosphorylase [Ruminococcaceae bacterium CPB6]QKN24811.1 pyrimidine-nucleoside phosphorylase [Caproicibacterium lactatifermentans]QKO31206.1 pyrimidine-nucleoside phosphorylase [Caproicibacterium lactatifermentans]
MYDIIAKKRDGGTLTQEEIQYFITGYVNGDIPDYQASAFLMAIYLRGMSAAETAQLTLAMAHSGDMVDLSAISGIKVDKHSTGGVGDKTTLIVAPVAASLGVRVAKMSGRGLGHTGGTIDKLESIPGLSTALSQKRFFEIVQEVGCCVVGQTGNLVPADKKMYALRDVTATVSSIPLIASSIMSKKIAAGADRILLDVKTGSGAFMKTKEDSIRLAEAMVQIGEHVGRRTVALITDMDRPLGRCIGNALEIKEVCQTLHGEGPDDLTTVCQELAANMLYLAGKGEPDVCRKMAREQMSNGAGFRKFEEMAAAQGGDISVLENPDRFPKAGASYTVAAEQDGWMTAMDTEKCGITAVELGAGREKKGEAIDHSAGIVLQKKTGDRVQRGEPIAVLYAATDEKCRAAAELFRSAVVISSQKPTAVPLIHARVTADGVEKFA